MRGHTPTTLCSKCRNVSARVNMESHAAKVNKLGRLRCRIPRVSHSALFAILCETQRELLPAMSRRDDIREARNSVIDEMTPCGPVHQKIPLPRDDGTIWWLEVASPLPLLFVLAKRSTSFCKLLKDTIAVVGPPSPTKPWKLGLYSDEIDPGDALMGNRFRNVQALYWSFIEFGPGVLSDESSWLTATTARSHVLKHVPAGISCLYSCVLKHFFRGVHEPHRAGVRLELADGTNLKMWFAFDMNIGDGDTVAHVNSQRTASGVSPCICCLNVKNKRSSELEHDAAGYFVSHTVSDLTAVRFRTDEMVHLAVDTLETRAAAETTSAFTLSQLHFDFTHNIGSLPLCKKLRDVYLPISCTQYDWMHCLFLDCVFNITVGVLMAVLVDHGITYAGLHAYLQLWTWPMRIQSKGASGKDQCRDSKAKKWLRDNKSKPSASQSLSLYPVVAAFLVSERQRLRIDPP